jgi:hypothetical protein
MNVSKGEISSFKAAPESNEKMLIFPVILVTIDLITIEFGMYRSTSMLVKTFDFSNSEFSMGRIELNIYGQDNVARVFVKFPRLPKVNQY